MVIYHINISIDRCCYEDVLIFAGDIVRDSNVAVLNYYYVADLCYLTNITLYILT